MSLQIIPAIDLIDGHCVRLQQGDYERKTQYSESPVVMAQRWAAENVEWIHLVDLDAARDGSARNLPVVQEICQTVSCRCELGGGIRSVTDAARAFDAGVDRVILGTALAENPEMADELVARFGSNRIVAGIDARNGIAAVRGWREDTGRDALDLARELTNHGIRIIIYTDIATDGMFTGPNLQAVSALCVAVPETTIVASGGIKNSKHVEKLVEIPANNLYGVIVGKALYDGKATLAELITAGQKD